MDKAILIFGIIFFAALSLYNMIHSAKHKKSYLPSVFGLLMALATALILFDRPILGGFAFVIMLLLAIFSSGKIFGIRKRSFLKAIEEVDINSTFSLRYIVDIRYWAVYALKNGSKKAAVGYSLSQTGLTAFVLVIVTYASPIATKFIVWIPLIFIVFVMGLREYNIIFKEFCESKI